MTEDYVLIPPHYDMPPHYEKLQQALHDFRAATGSTITAVIGNTSNGGDDDRLHAYLTPLEAEALIAMRKADRDNAKFPVLEEWPSPERAAELVAKHTEDLCQQKPGMRIALDYDATYSLDPGFWNAVIFSAEQAGHEVRIVTARDERYDRTEGLLEAEKVLPVIYTRGVAKRWYLSHFGEGFVPDVWIDDRPESIIQNSNFAPDELAHWRANRVNGKGI